jgi:hypothetical protein
MHDDALRISPRFLASNMLNTLLPPNAHQAAAPRSPIGTTEQIGTRVLFRTEF